jgi:hypothetical protein
MHLIPSLYQTPHPIHRCNVQPHYLRCAPKFVRFLLVDVSFSLSSASIVFFFDLLAFLTAVVDVGVGWFDGPSRNAADDGVAPAGVEPPDPGVIPSCRNPWLAFSSATPCQHRLCALPDCSVGMRSTIAKRLGFAPLGRPFVAVLPRRSCLSCSCQSP